MINESRKKNETVFEFGDEYPKSIITDGGARVRKNDPPGFGKRTFWKKGGVKITRRRRTVVFQKMVCLKF